MKASTRRGAGGGRQSRFTGWNMRMPAVSMDGMSAAMVYACAPEVFRAHGGRLLADAAWG